MNKFKLTKWQANYTRERIESTCNLSQLWGIKCKNTARRWKTLTLMTDQYPIGVEDK